MARLGRGAPARPVIVRGPTWTLYSGDVTLTETVAVTTAAVVDHPSTVTLTETVTFTVDATVTNNDVAQAAAFDFTSAAVTQAAAMVGRPNRPTVTRTQLQGAANSADVTLTETVTVTTAATRDQPAAVTLTETVAITVDATTSTDIPQPAVLDFTQAALAVAGTLTGRPNRTASIIRTPASAPGLADVTLTEAWSVTADATVTSSDVPQPAVFDFTQAAQAAAARMYARPVDAVTLYAPTEASSGQTADAALTETWAVTTAATRGQVAAVAPTETWTVTADATRGQSPTVTLTETVAITVDGVVNTPGTASVVLTETAGVTATASLGARAAVALAETWTVTATVETGITGQVVLTETVSFNVSATVTAEPVNATSTDSVVAGRTSVDAVEARRTSLATVI